MKMKQQRGWLKLMLASAMVMAFMLAMSVTAFAGADGTLTVTPAYAVEGTVAEVTVSLNTAALHDVSLRVQWDTAQMQLVTPAAQGIRPVAGTGFGMPVPPPPAAIEAGNMLVNLENTDAEKAFMNLDLNGPVVTFRFNLPAGTANGVAVPVTITVEGAGKIDAAGMDLEPAAVSGPGAVTVTCAHWWLVGWNYFNETLENQGFIVAISPEGTVLPNGTNVANPATHLWFNYVVSDVWPVVNNIFGTTVDLTAAVWYWENIMIPTGL